LEGSSWIDFYDRSVSKVISGSESWQDRYRDFTTMNGFRNLHHGAIATVCANDFGAFINSLSGKTNRVTTF